MLPSGSVAVFAQKALIKTVIVAQDVWSCRELVFMLCCQSA